MNQPTHQIGLSQMMRGPGFVSSGGSAGDVPPAGGAVAVNGLGRAVGVFNFMEMPND